MGAQSFVVRSNGKNVQDAFLAAVEQARYDYGHAGYTGTIAEKHEFVMITLPAGENDPENYAEQLISKDDKRISDKWGPAGCIALGGDEYLFFGLASS